MCSSSVTRASARRSFCCIIRREKVFPFFLYFLHDDDFAGSGDVRDVMPRITRTTQQPKLGYTKGSRRQK
jgi:hypothetical protein